MSPTEGVNYASPTRSDHDHGVLRRGRAARGAVMTAWDLDREPRSLLTTSNPKTAKGEGHGYLTAILHLAPADLSGSEVCPFRTPGCSAACLNTAGRGGIALDEDGLNLIQVARIRRTRAYNRNRRGFVDRLAEEISRHVARAERHGLKPAVRLNGTSDIKWQTQRGSDGRTLFERFPAVVFYDYTKRPVHLWGRLPLGYSLTFSCADGNEDEARAVLAAG